MCSVTPDKMESALISFGRFVAVSNELLCRAIGHQSLNLQPVLVQLALAGTLRPPQLLARPSACCQCLLGALTDGIALNFYRHGKCHRHDFRFNRSI